MKLHSFGTHREQSYSLFLVLGEFGVMAGKCGAGLVWSGLATINLKSRQNGRVLVSALLLLAALESAYVPAVNGAWLHQREVQEAPALNFPNVWDRLDPDFSFDPYQAREKFPQTLAWLCSSLKHQYNSHWLQWEQFDHHCVLWVPPPTGSWCEIEASSRCKLLPKLRGI